MNDPFTVIDLFSGIGGMSLGLERAGMKTVAFCEIEPFCQQVLKKHWPDVPIYDDVRSFDYDGRADVICGGYPCQPFSQAGKRQGENDNRYLWPAMFSLIQKYRPSWVLGENVAGHISMGLDDVLADLEGEGYACGTFVIPACAVGANHRRDRVWIVADSQGYGCKRGRNAGQGQQNELERCLDGLKAEWPPEPGVGRVAHGVSRRVDRLRALGNAVVPQIPEMIGRAILQAEGRI